MSFKSTMLSQRDEVVIPIVNPFLFLKSPMRGMWESHLSFKVICLFTGKKERVQPGQHCWAVNQPALLASHLQNNNNKKAYVQLTLSGYQ